MMSQIQNFYKDKHVFITGANGFIGKILVEKLLRSTGVDTLYLLMRKKKGKEVYSRLEEMLENEPFRKLKALQPDFKKRLKVIVANDALPNLGLSKEDEETLSKKISIVFHVAATVRFHEPIKIAYNTNVRMTKKIIDLCKKMHNLKSFLYVSTAYSNCYENEIDEIFYDFEYEKIEAMLSEISGEENLTKNILKKWPNTYSFTKAVAELLIRDSANLLPVGVFRPSIVISTYKEPLQGWTDSLGGPNILMATVASGFTRFFCCDVENVVDLVPVDMTVAALIASAWDVSQNQQFRKIPIYNFVSSVDNPITYDEFNTLNILVYTGKYPFYNCLWAPSMTITKQSSIKNFILNATLHYLPALLIDIGAILTLKKPSMFAKYRKFTASRYHMEYFMAHEWTFNNNNVKLMWNKMSATDQKLFSFDVTQVNWVLCLRNYYKGIRQYLFKEPWQNLEAAKIKARRLKILHNVFLFVFYVFGAKVIWLVFRKLLLIHKRNKFCQ